jgi:hypothetical protein
MKSMMSDGVEWRIGGRGNGLKRLSNEIARPKIGSTGIAGLGRKHQ